MILEYCKVRDNAITPERANPSDAGLDVFFCPSPLAADWGAADHGIDLSPGQSVILGTGLKFAVPHGYMLEVKNRSGNAAKKHLLVGACVVDSGYDGEVFINLHNVGNVTQTVEAGTKIAQIVMVPVVHFRAVETNRDNLYDWYPITISNRGAGSLGSTGE